MSTRVAHSRDRSHPLSTTDRWSRKSKCSEGPTESDLHGSGNGEGDGRPDAHTCGLVADDDRQRGNLKNEDQCSEDQLDDA